MKAVRNAHKKHQKKRARARRLESLRTTLVSASKAVVSSSSTAGAVRVLRVRDAHVDGDASMWDALGVLDPERGGRLHARRAQRKRWQVESVARILRDIVQPGDRCVDFGAGSGNFGLPLASMFPMATWTFVEMNAVACELMRARARSAGLTNTTVIEGRIEDYVAAMIAEGAGGAHAFEVGVAMHACGAATDFAQLACMQCGAAFVLCPCCVGKLQLASRRSGNGGTNSAAAGDSTEPPAAKVARSSSRSSSSSNDAEAHLPTLRLLHPRSRWLRALIGADEFSTLASIADHNALAQAASSSTVVVTDGAKRIDVHRRCKVLLELDRARCAEEGGYATFLSRLEPPVASKKRDIIVGIPTRECSSASAASDERWRAARATFSAGASDGAGAGARCWSCTEVNVGAALERSAAIEEAAPTVAQASTAGDRHTPAAVAAAESSASASASASALPLPVVDVGGRPAELDHVQVRSRCTFVIERKERRCRNFVTEATSEDGTASAFCSDHMPRALAKSRAFSQNEKAVRLAREAAVEGGTGGPSEDAAAALGGTAIPKRVSSSQKRMANPFAVQHQRAVEPLEPSGDGAPFDDPSRPLHIDIGCAKGRFIAALARDGARRAAAGSNGARAWNYLGLEIRPALAVAANEQHCWTGTPPHAADGESMRGVLHYVACNVDVALSAPGLKRCSGNDGPPSSDAPSGHLLSRMPSGVLQRVSLQFPTPWRKRKHRRRRILQKRLVAAVAALMPQHAEFYVSSDIVDVALDMCALIEESGKFVAHPTAARGAVAISGRCWLARCPFPVLSEREYCCEETGVRVYRETYVRNAL